jgi:hypothetical protein
MNRNAPLLHEIDAFLTEEPRMTEYRFGFSAVKNGRLLERLRDGKRIWPETEMEVRAFIRSRRRARAESAA